MFYREIKLRDFFPMLSDLGGDPILKLYARDNSHEIDLNRSYPGVLVCPGGGYCFVSDREAEPVALAYLNAGFNAFVLTYSVAPAKYPQALLQACAAMAYIRATADQTHTDPDKIAVCGFSAGGHLAGSLGCFWHETFLADTLGCESDRFKPNAMVLSYAVITALHPTHQGSFDSLCGDDRALREKMSLETAVTADTPPAFIWHTVNDTCVPVINSMVMAEALHRAGKRFELHLFADGSHGLSVCNETSAGPQNPNMINPACAPWLGLSVTFLRQLFS